MNIIQYPLKPKQWIATKVKKSHIVWHSTFDRTLYTPIAGKPGRSTAIIDTWNNSVEKYALCYLVDRNGSIYQTYPDDEWSYHTGLPNYYDKISIPVGICNEGPLLVENSQYYAFQRVHHSTQYFGKVIKKQWKGFEYWADYSNAQISSLVELTKHLCDKHKIEFNVSLDFANWNRTVWEQHTVFTHSVINKTQKDFIITEKLKEEIIK